MKPGNPRDEAIQTLDKGSIQFQAAAADAIARLCQRCGRRCTRTSRKEASGRRYIELFCDPSKGGCGQSGMAFVSAHTVALQGGKSDE